MTNCDGTREFLLEHGWDQAGREHAVEVLQHLQTCSTCQRAVQDYDALRGVMRCDAPSAEPEGGWDSLERRLLQNLQPRSLRWQWPVRALAACVLVGLLGYGLMWWMEPKSSQPQNHSVLASLQITPHEAAQQAMAFEQVSQVFDRKASWLLVADGISDMGLSQEIMPVKRSVLLVRLTMLKGKEVISSADLAIVPGQTANLTVPLKQGHQLHYEIGTSSSEPTHLTVWVELQKPNRSGQTLAALATSLSMEPGQKLSAGKMVSSSGAYELTIAFARSNLPEDKP